MVQNRGPLAHPGKSGIRLHDHRADAAARATTPARAAGVRGWGGGGPPSRTRGDGRDFLQHGPGYFRHRRGNLGRTRDGGGLTGEDLVRVPVSSPHEEIDRCWRRVSWYRDTDTSAGEWG